jgi:glycosidase
VANQAADTRSLLNTVRTLIALRKAHPALCANGDCFAKNARNDKLMGGWFEQ